jgi:hypothetical protein
MEMIMKSKPEYGKEFRDGEMMSFAECPYCRERQYDSCPAVVSGPDMLQRHFPSCRSASLPIGQEEQIA